MTTLYHLIRHRGSIQNPDVGKLVKEAGISQIPQARVAVLVGNAWDPAPGVETPWMDIARQLAGDQGAAALGPEARIKVPGTNNLRRLIEAAGGRVLILWDEVLNFLSRHRDQAESFWDFLGNLVRTLTGTQGCSAVVSLPHSKPEMSHWDLRWQDIVVKEVNRVAKKL